MRTLRVIWRQVLMNVMLTLEYRGAFFVYMVYVVAAPLISLLVWLTVSEQGVQLPYDRSQFVTYYVLLGLVNMLTNTWLGPYVADSIRLGGLSEHLLRPAPYVAHYIGNNIGEKIIKLPLLLPLIALVALIFRRDLHLPADPRAWLLFAVSLPMAAAIALLLDLIVASLAFWLQEVQGLLRVKAMLGALLAGQFVPLALFPPALSRLLEAQPFRYTLSFPLEVLMGGLSSQALIRGLVWQAGYCLGFWACCRLLWQRGLRAYTAPGR